ncbi:hypothetical protein SEVIR_9G316900v4 [Setaria viridis]|uniref:USP domain-containing protein n=1 Tax=Setaria viridis TaxID=4556 RepID=A0A4U6T455_SETVI|nr:hypothetical protein SEVIR_9G316900v2 [Setaria viridis]
MAAAEAAEAVIAQMPAEPPPVAAGAVVEPPPVAADVVETFVEPPPIAADAVETVGTPPPADADDSEAAAAPIPFVPLPPPPPPPPPEQKVQSVMDGGEELLPNEILKVIESIEVQLPSLADDQKPCDMVVSDNSSRESDKQVPTQPCPSSQQQIPMDTDDLSDDSPTRNPNDDSDHSDDGCCDDPFYYRFIHGRERRYRGYRYICDARRDYWLRDYPFFSGLESPCNPMTSANTGHLSHWSSPKPDCGKKRYNVGAGLFNPRLWTCFLNCILQCMVHTVPLVLKLRKADHPDPCPRASIGFCCFCSLKLHADESIRLSGSAFYPERFVNHLKSISSNFESGVQQDAQEFFFDLLEKLDEAYVSPRSSEEPSSTEEGGIAKQIFGGRLKSQLRCPECKRCSDKSEPFIDLSLEVTMVESLMDALHSFTKVELIEDFMCDGCNSRVNMEKHFKVEQAPEVLVIHLKRFTNSRGKIWDKVKYPLELDINSFMSSSDDTPQKYDLYGVVVHHGIYGRGHYVCYIRSSVDDWYEFNDDKVCRCFEASVLDSAAYLLFYVKQGSSPWFSTLLEKEDKFPQDGSVSLAEQEENGNGSSLPEFSQDIQQNGNGNTLSDSTDKLAEGCCLGGMSGGTQELSCLTGSSDKNGHADGFLEPWEKEDVSLRGSLDTDEINPSTHGSSEIDPTVTEGGSPPKICSLLQVSHKYDDKPWEKEDVSPSGSLDTKEMNPSTHGYSEVDPVVTPGGSPPKGENICSLLQLSHKYDDKSWEKEDVSPRGSLETKEMNPSTHGSSEFDPAVAKGGSSPKGENICSLLQLSHKYDDKSWENVNPRGSLDTKELNPSTQGSSEVDPAVTQGGSPPKSENICSSLQLSHKYGNNCGCRNFSSQGCREEGNGGCKGEKRKRPSCADTGGGGGGISKASKRRTKLRAVARYFDLCRRRAWAAAGEWKKSDDDGNYRGSGACRSCTAPP